MAVIEALADDEAYLWAILSDASGLDLAEFSLHDANEDDGCWRAWPFQWAWFRCIDPLQIDQCARSVGKSLSVKLRAYGFPFLHPQEEMVITAPELVHLHPITGLVENIFLSNRLGREMLPRGRNAGITHRPFQMDFVNGSRIIGRIPQRDGKGVKGVHPLWLELDEGQDYPDPGWVELIETLKRGVEGAVWRAHGVTRGVRDYFYKFTQPESGWRVHRFMAMHRPNWSDEERQEKIDQYGSRDHPDYRRNVLGLHGDATNPMFVLHRLMAIVDSDEASDYNLVQYQNLRINSEMLADLGQPIESLLNFHRPDGYVGFWCGMDVGYTNHPSEILIFGEELRRGKPSLLKLLVRIHLERIANPDQVDVILHVLETYRPKGFAMDKTGVGLPLFQDLQARAPQWANVIKGYNFSSKILVDFDTTIEVDEFRGDAVRDAGIQRNVLEYACVDEETELLTKRGWKRHHDLSLGEDVYTLNPETQLGEWATLQDVLRYDGSHSVRHLRTRTFDSLTTMNHRWWTERYDPHSRKRIREWRATAELVGASAIPCAAHPASNPSAVTFDDALVELVAWFWTEGCFHWGRRKWSGASLAQSQDVNPDKVLRIRRCLEVVYGDAGWRETSRNGMVEWHLSTQSAELLRLCMSAPEKVVDPEFLSQLTTNQLNLFIETSIDADGWRTPTGSAAIGQKSEARLRSFEMACVLTGRPVHTFKTAHGWQTKLLKRRNVTPVNTARAGRGISMSVERTHEGVVWCPRTKNSTFLARRAGTVYFTGNSDKLREFVDGNRLQLPWDRDLIAEFQGQTYTVVRDSVNMYGRKEFNKGKFHALDGARMAILGYVQFAIEAMVAKEPTDAVTDIFLSAF